MNNFIFENSTKTFFGRGCVREYLACLSGHYGEKVLLCYGGGSIKKNGVYDEVMESMKKAGKKVCAGRCGYGSEKNRGFLCDCLRQLQKGDA